jgi:hypothetical protein
MLMLVMLVLVIVLAIVIVFGQGVLRGVRLRSSAGHVRDLDVSICFAQAARATRGRDSRMSRSASARPPDHASP